MNPNTPTKLILANQAYQPTKPKSNFVITIGGLVGEPW
jgi:hypothetical protein